MKSLFIIVLLNIACASVFATPAKYHVVARADSTYNRHIQIANEVGERKWYGYKRSGWSPCSYLEGEIKYTVGGFNDCRKHQYPNSYPHPKRYGKIVIVTDGKGNNQCALNCSD